uniref:Major facilitator superfamily (MFS) profile domain-containing protein n=1 Tax=Uncultured archaeon GZfos26G2 TaxID=3386331 RepID=Q64CU4_UNCAG|nr:hypothetical protein GZ1C11_15 [uncultured archaeon GZfos1C11]
MISFIRPFVFWVSPNIPRSFISSPSTSIRTTSSISNSLPLPLSISTLDSHMIYVCINTHIKKGSEMKTVKKMGFTLLPLSASHGVMHILATALPALSLLVKDEFQLSNTTIGLLSFAFAAAIGFGGIPSGMLSDRSDGIKLICIGFFSTALLSAFLLIVPNFLSVALIFIAIGFLLSLYHPAALSYIAKSFSETRGKAYGVHELGASIGIAIAPLIAGFISSLLRVGVSYIRF